MRSTTGRSTPSYANRTRRRLLLECLHDRRMLAGDVTASEVNGDLIIMGDAAANGVYVSDEGDGNFAVHGIDLGGSPTTINGAAGPETFAITGDVIVDLFDGDDKFGLGGAEFLDEFEGFFDSQ